MNRTRLRRTRGFTLVELLVSVGLTAVLMWGLLQLYTSATRFSATMFTEAELVSGGRAVLDRMSHELASTATLDVGYFRISNDPVEDGTTGVIHDIGRLEFVAPVGADGENAHVCYMLRSASGGGFMLYRLVKVPVDTSNLPSPDTDGDWTSISPLGVRVQGMRIQYINYTSMSGTPQGGSNTWEPMVAGAPTVPSLPRAILLEITLSDNKGTITMVLSSGAYLGGSGI